MLSLEFALEPYQASNKDQDQNQNRDLNFDLLQLITDAKDDQELVLAVTQIENQTSHPTTSRMAMMAKRNSPRKPKVFSGCTFGNIGTLNIHIHKS